MVLGPRAMDIQADIRATVTTHTVIRAMATVTTRTGILIRDLMDILDMDTVTLRTTMVQIIRGATVSISLSGTTIGTHRDVTLIDRTETITTAGQQYKNSTFIVTIESVYSIQVRNEDGSESLK